jgi:transcriptional regulator with XRE-family HTH domain
VSRSRQLRPLPGDLPETTQTLLHELRSLRERAGYDLRALGGRTYASRSSWGRWLSGETWIPLEAVETLADVCGGDVTRLRALWLQADEERRSPDEDDRSSRHAAAAGDGVRTGATGPYGDPVPGGRRKWMPVAAASGGCAVVFGAIGVATGASLRPGPHPSPSASPSPHTYTEWLTRPEIIARARTWNPHHPRRVRYDQGRYFMGYRTDGSGYASMALGLPAPGPNSTDLAWGRYTTPIPATRLLPGDLIINATGGSGIRQVAIFEKWADASHRSYWVYQQRRGYGTDHLVVSYSLAAGSDYHPYRPLNIHEQPAGPPS